MLFVTHFHDRDPASSSFTSESQFPTLSLKCALWPAGTGHGGEGSGSSDLTAFCSMLTGRQMSSLDYGFHCYMQLELFNFQIEMQTYFRIKLFAKYFSLFFLLCVCLYMHVRIHVCVSACVCWGRDNLGFLLFCDRVSLRSPGWPRTCSVDETGLLTCWPLPPKN